MPHDYAAQNGIYMGYYSLEEQNSMTGSRIIASIPYSEIDPTNRLLAACHQGDSQVQGLFPLAIDNISTYATQLVTPRRDAVAKALLAYQLQIAAHTAALANARLIAEPDTLLVTCGQQPGLFSGPFYSITKALSAINFAAYLTRETGRATVPLFWLACDDDDRDEADHCACWDNKYTASELRYPVEAIGSSSLIGDMPLGEAAEAILAQLTELTSDMPFADETCEFIRLTLRESADFGEWNARILSHLLSRYGLVICDSRLPELRQLAVPMLHREISNPLQSTNAVNLQATCLQQAGFAPQLTKPADCANFFYLSGGQRQRVTFQHNHYQIAEKSYGIAELLALLYEQPENFISNAVLRPLVQESLFHSSAFICGPNEFNYWAQLAPVFATFDLPMPPVLPRAGVTVVPARVKAMLDEWHATPLQLLQQFPELRRSLLEELRPQENRQAFAESRQDIERMAERLSSSVAALDATLVAAAAGTRQRMLNELAQLEKKAIKALERRSETLMTRLDFCRETLFPCGKLQERTLSIVALLARYGCDVIEYMRFDTAEQEGRHLFVEM